MKTMIVTEHLGFSELNYSIFSNVNKIVSSSLKEVSIVPMDVSNKMMQILTAVMNVSEMSSFSDGVVIAANIDHAKEIASLVTNSRKLLYLWDLDWMYKKMSFIEVYEILNNPKLDIIVRSKTHQNVVDKLLKNKKTLGIVKTFDLEKIWNLL